MFGSVRTSGLLAIATACVSSCARSEPPDRPAVETASAGASGDEGEAGASGSTAAGSTGAGAAGGVGSGGANYGGSNYGGSNYGGSSGATNAAGSAGMGGCTAGCSGAGATGATGGVNCANGPAGETYRVSGTGFDTDEGRTVHILSSGLYSPAPPTELTIENGSFEFSWDSYPEPGEPHSCNITGPLFPIGMLVSIDRNENDACDWSEDAVFGLSGTNGDSFTITPDSPRCPTLNWGATAASSPVTIVSAPCWFYGSREGDASGEGGAGGSGEGGAGQAGEASPGGGPSPDERENLADIAMTVCGP
jgi:hypothetical protein